MSESKIGNKVKQLRIARKLSQEKLGEIADLSQQHISRIEKGLSEPEMSTILKLAKAFNIPVEDLISIEIKKRIDTYTIKIMRKLEFLSIEDKSKVSGYIDRILDENGVDLYIIK